MKGSLALSGFVLLCASAVSGAGLTVQTHAVAWLPSVGVLGHLSSIASLPEPIGLLFLARLLKVW